MLSLDRFAQAIAHAHKRLLDADEAEQREWKDNEQDPQPVEQVDFIDVLGVE